MNNDQPQPPSVVAHRLANAWSALLALLILWVLFASSATLGFGALGWGIGAGLIARQTYAAVGDVRWLTRRLWLVTTQNVGSDLLPGNARTWVRVRVGETSVEFSCEFCRHRERFIRSVLCDRVPQIADQPQAVAPQVRAVVARSAPGEDFRYLGPLASYLDGDGEIERGEFTANLLIGFSVGGFILALLGAIALIDEVVRTRTSEIGSAEPSAPSPRAW